MSADQDHINQAASDIAAAAKTLSSPDATTALDFTALDAAVADLKAVTATETAEPADLKAVTATETAEPAPGG